MKTVNIKFDQANNSILVNGECLSEEHAKAYMNYNVPMSWGDSSDGTKQTAVVLALHLGQPLSVWKKIFAYLSMISKDSGEYLYNLETFEMSSINMAPVVKKHKNSKPVQADPEDEEIE